MGHRVSHKCREHGGGGCGERQGGSSKFDGGALVKTWGDHGGGGVLKCCRKIPVKEFI